MKFCNDIPKEKIEYIVTHGYMKSVYHDSGVPTAGTESDIYYIPSSENDSTNIILIVDYVRFQDHWYTYYNEFDNNEIIDGKIVISPYGGECGIITLTIDNNNFEFTDSRSSCMIYSCNTEELGSKDGGYDEVTGLGGINLNFKGGKWTFSEMHDPFITWKDRAHMLKYFMPEQEVVTFYLYYDQENKKVMGYCPNELVR